MADNSLDILIRILTEQVGSEKADQIIKKVNEETKKSTQVTEENTKATDKAFVSKKNLKDAVKGLAVEFPLLGHIAHLALNPIAFVVAGIAGAFVIWKKKVDELTVSLGGIQMADVSTDQVARIEAAAAAWGKFAARIAEVKNASIGINKDLDATIKKIKFLDELRKATGQDTGNAAILAEIGVKESAADVLEREAARKRKASGTPGSPEKEAVLEAQFKEAAIKASQDMGESRKRLFEVGEAEKAPWWSRVISDNKFRLRYGFGTSFQAAREMEQSNIASQQEIIDRYGRFEQDKAGRAGRRGQYESARADDAQVEALRNEVIELRRQLLVSQTKATSDFVPVLNSVTGVVQVAIEIAKASQSLAEAYRVLKASGDQLKASVSVINNTSSNLRRP